MNNLIVFCPNTNSIDCHKLTSVVTCLPSHIVGCAHICHGIRGFGYVPFIERSWRGHIFPVRFREVLFREELLSVDSSFVEMELKPLGHVPGGGDYRSCWTRGVCLSAKGNFIALTTSISPRQVFATVSGFSGSMRLTKWFICSCCKVCCFERSCIPESFNAAKYVRNMPATSLIQPQAIAFVT